MRCFSPPELAIWIGLGLPSVGGNIFSKSENFSDSLDILETMALTPVSHLMQMPDALIVGKLPSSASLSLHRGFFGTRNFLQ
jgi:hypothetical protein